MFTVPSSERLNYRLLTQADEQHLLEVDSDPAVMRYLNGGVAHNLEQIKSIWIPRMMAYRDSQRGTGIWGVFAGDTLEYLGWILVRPMYFFDGETPTDNTNYELGWRFKQSTWGNGFATEAAQHIMLQHSQQNNIKDFTAIAHPSNKASISVMTKIGMHYLKTEFNSDPVINSEMEHYGIHITSEQ